MTRSILLIAIAAILFSLTGTAMADHHEQWITYEGEQGPGKGKHIVLIAGDEEYRSEEALPQMGMILARHHGFTCTVVFPINKETGEIDPQTTTNIPGLEALDKADLMIIATRFRDLPEEQMKHINAFLMAGKPVIGMRTATHAFNIGDKSKPYSHYSFNYNGEKKDWKQGFGRLVLGETWISHHGGHKREGCRGLIAPGAESHPITNGIEDGDIWGPSDVYGVRLPLPGDSKPIILGQVQQDVKHDGGDRWFGMRPDDPPLPADHKKNDPMMPIAWTKSYQLPEGKEGTAFTTTMGAATDLEAEGSRRMLVNAIYFLMEMEVPKKADVATVGEFTPTAYGFGGHKKGMKPADYKMPE